MEVESEVESEKSSKVAMLSRFRPGDLLRLVRRAILRRSVEFHRIWRVLGRVGVKIGSLELSARFWGMPHGAYRRKGHPRAFPMLLARGMSDPITPRGSTSPEPSGPSD